MSFCRSYTTSYSRYVSLLDACLPAPQRSILQVHIEEGVMICPNCNHAYPISNGIPNMVSPPAM